MCTNNLIIIYVHIFMHIQLTYAVYVLMLTLSPFSPFEDVKGSNSPGLCLNLYNNINNCYFLKVWLMISKKVYLNIQGRSGGSEKLNRRENKV